MVSNHVRVGCATFHQGVPGSNPGGLTIKSKTYENRPYNVLTFVLIKSRLPAPNHILRWALATRVTASPARRDMTAGYKQLTLKKVEFLNLVAARLGMRDVTDLSPANLKHAEKLAEKYLEIWKEADGEDD